MPPSKTASTAARDARRRRRTRLLLSLSKPFGWWIGDVIARVSDESAMSIGFPLSGFPAELVVMKPCARRGSAKGVCPTWRYGQVDKFRVSDDSGVERRFARAPELPRTLFLNGTGYQESKLES